MSDRLPADLGNRSATNASTTQSVPSKKARQRPSRSRTAYQLSVVIDTREQRPFEFPAEVNTMVGTLATGDYSVQGWTPFISVERKSWADFYGCLTKGRERFERCLERLSKVRYPAVVIEGSIADFDKMFFYRDQRGRICTSQVPPLSAKKTLIAWMWRYRVPIWLAGDGGLSRNRDGSLACGDLPGRMSKTNPDGRDAAYWGRAKDNAMKWTLLLLQDAVRVMLREQKESDRATI